MNNMKDLSWSFYQVWNESLEKRDERPLRKRENIWASELGGSFIDRYLKMNATPMTNPPNPRSLRKFEAGNLMEWIVGVVLKRAGILLESQGWNTFQYPGLLAVNGKTDYKAGGQPDWERAKSSLSELTELGLPPIFEKLGNNIVSYFINKFGMNQLRNVTLEIKSCSAFMFENYERSKTANENHILQNFHCLKGQNEEEGHVVYISKDDLRLLEFGVFNPSPIEDIYKKDIEIMTGYIRSKQEPPLEKEIDFKVEFGKFYANWKVGYSNYLTKLYGYKDQMEFDNKYKPMVAQYNRVFKRCVLGQNMTKLNLDVIVEAKKQFPDFDDLVEKVKISGVLKEEPETETPQV